MAGLWVEARLTGLRTPACVDGEAQLFLGEVHSVEPTANRDMQHAGTVTLTSHRLVWVNRAATLALALPLAKIAKFTETCCGLFHGSKKITIETAESARVDIRFSAKYQLGDKLTAALAAKRWAQPASAPRSLCVVPPPPQRSLAVSIVPSSSSPSISGASPKPSAGLSPKARSPVGALQEKAAELARIGRRIQCVKAKDGCDDPELESAFARAGVALPKGRRSWMAYRAGLAKQTNTFCAAVLQSCGPALEMDELCVLHKRLRDIEALLDSDIAGACDLLDGMGAALPAPMCLNPSEEQTNEKWT